MPRAGTRPSASGVAEGKTLPGRKAVCRLHRNKPPDWCGSLEGVHSEGVQALVICTGRKQNNECQGCFEGFIAEKQKGCIPCSFQFRILSYWPVISPGHDPYLKLPRLHIV